MFPGRPARRGNRRWRRRDAQVVQRCRVFDVSRQSYAHGNEPSARDYFVIHAPNWINVIAVKDDDHVLMVRQFRFGIAADTLEIPGGMVDPGEEPLAAGVRELSEETGFGSGKSRLIGSVTPNPAILNNRCHTVIVEEAVAEGPARLESHEEIGVRLVPLDSIPTLIAEGRIHHALVVAAFHHLDLDERR